MQWAKQPSKVTQSLEGPHLLFVLFYGVTTQLPFLVPKAERWPWEQVSPC